jgi:aminopeptidase N
VRAQYAPRLHELGWVPAASEPHARKELRATLLRLPGTERDPEVLAEARRLTEQTLADYGAVDPSIRDVAVSLAAAAGDAALYDRYRQKLALAKTPAEYYLYLYSLALFPEPELQQRTLAFALGPEVRAQDMSGLLATMIVGRESQRAAWQFVVDNWEKVRAKTPEGLYGAESALAGVSGSFCSAEQRAAVVGFFEQHPMKNNDRPLRRALESIDGCMGLRERQQAPFDAWVKRHGMKVGE